MSKRKGQEKGKKNTKKARNVVSGSGAPFFTLLQDSLATISKSDCVPTNLGTVLTEARLPSNWEAYLPKKGPLVSDVDLVFQEFDPEFLPQQTYQLSEIKKHVGAKKPSYTILCNVERHSPEVDKFIAEFNAMTQGDGGAEVDVQVYNTQEIDPIVRLSKRKHLLLVLQGSLDLTIEHFEPEEPSYQDKFAEGDGPDCCDEDGGCCEEGDTCSKKEVFHLQPNSLVYLPSGSAYSLANPAKSKSVLLFHIYFFPPVNWLDLVNTTLEDSITALGLDDKESKPDQTLSCAQTTLAKALDLLPETYERFQARSKFNHQSFSLPADFRGADFDLNKLLDENNGFLKLNNFLPEDIAERIYSTVTALKSSEWEISTADDDLGSGDTDHSFLSSDGFPNCSAIFSLFRNLIPGTRSIFSAGRYNVGHFIDEHSDEAHQVLGDQIYSRTIAVVYHLCKDWKEEYGGIFTDAVTETNHVPEFNSCIIFRVPRSHCVSPVVKANGRYSIFGWFLKFEKRVELDEDEEEEENSE